MMAFDIDEIRADYPVLAQEINGHPLVYLDNAATTQVPLEVLEVATQHHLHEHANVHRGIHTLSERSTTAYERARERVRSFIHARFASEIVFTGGTTDGINRVARFIEQILYPGQAVVTTLLEHHANFVPWQQACKRTGADFLVCGLTPEGDIDLDDLQQLLASHEVALVTITHASNVTGAISPVRTICDLAHQNGALVLVDAAQSIRHELVDVQSIDCDFLVYSSHKILGMMGLGVLYGKRELLDRFEPVVFGGEMIDTVASDETTFAVAPLRHEAGTPNCPGALVHAAALDYLEHCGLGAVRAREHALTKLCREALSQIGGVKLLGSPAEYCGCVSFSIDGVNPFDIACLVDNFGIALRSGHMCAQPLLRDYFGVERICRISPAFYNTESEIEFCAEIVALLVRALTRR